ncbi:MAG: hypothetical protein J7M19_06015 [Planctomycetes bacterium]|nr:hypothetical protein [Planctomycetota bacterium]
MVRFADVAGVEDRVRILLFGIIMLVFVVLLLIAERSMMRKKRRRFQDRADITEYEFYRTYYKDTGISKETVCEVLCVVGSGTEIPATRIRPSDRFDKELAAVRGWEWDDGLVEVEWYLRDKKKNVRE